MKLVLSAEALERLIGNDTQIEIEIRQQIADQFAKRYLKSLIETEGMRVIAKEMTDGLSLGYVVNNSNSQYRTKIQELCRNFVDAECKKYLESSAVFDAMQKMVDRASEFVVANLQEAILTKRIDQLVDIKIKQRLGI